MSGPSNHINAGSWAFVISSLGQPGIRFRSISNQSLNRLRHELVDPSLCKVARTNSVKCRLLWSKNRARVRACVWSGNDWITACLELNPIEAPSGDCWSAAKMLAFKERFRLLSLPSTHWSIPDHRIRGCETLSISTAI